MTKTVTLECACGEVKGQLEIAPKSYFHVHCLCCDCQSFAAHLNNEQHILDQYGGSELFQTYPSLMNITQGKAQISAVQQHEKGIYRWYAHCCNTPIANTMTSAGVPFVGVSVKFMAFANEQQKLEVLGPVSLKAFGKYSKGEMPKDAHARFPMSFMPKIIGFMLKGLLTGKHKHSPFFKNKQPITAINKLF